MYLVLEITSYPTSRWSSSVLSSHTWNILHFAIRNSKSTWNWFLYFNRRELLGFLSIVISQYFITSLRGIEVHEVHKTNGEIFLKFQWKEMSSERSHNSGDKFSLSFCVLFFCFVLFLFFVSSVAWHAGSWFPEQGSNPCPLQWKHRVLPPGWPGKSQIFPKLIWNVSPTCFPDTSHPVPFVMNEKRTHIVMWGEDDVEERLSGSGSMKMLQGYD